MGNSASVIDLRAGSTLRAEVNHEEGRIMLSLLGNGGTDVVLLALTEGGAVNLVAEVEDLLPELTGEPPQCRECLGTGDLWIPVGRGAVSLRACPCGARETSGL